MVVTSTKQKLNWNARGRERVAQNASNLLQVGYYENAYERTMGNRALDGPGTSQDRVRTEVYRNFSTFMPQVNVLDVRMPVAAGGNMELEVDITNGG